MGLETANYVADLVATNPTTNDPVAQGDDQIRLLKTVLKASFPLVTGALNATMVPFTPAGNLAATTVAAALAELDSEKYSVGGALGTPSSGNLTNCTFPTLNQNTTGNAATATTASAIADGAVSTSAKLAANVVTTAKLAREGTAGQVLISGGTGADPGYADAPGVPAGAMLPYAGTTAPSGWLMCYGQSLSTTTYATLFAAIGYTFGGAGASFNVPDARGRVVAGKDDMGGMAASRLTSPVVGATLGATGGAQSHTLSTTEMPSHSHNKTVWSGSAGGAAAFSNSMTPDASTTVASPFVDATGGGAAHNNVQPTIVANYIIKT